jgi:hypothetical protein
MWEKEKIREVHFGESARRGCGCPPPKAEFRGKVVGIVDSQSKRKGIHALCPRTWSLSRSELERPLWQVQVGQRSNLSAESMEMVLG